MSEKKEDKMIVELKKEDRELLQSVIKSNEITTESKPEPHHWKADEVIAHMSSNCPECKGEGEKLTKTLGEAYLKEHDDKLPYFCVDCGTHVKGDEESCPTCGGKNAKERHKK